MIQHVITFAFRQKAVVIMGLIVWIACGIYSITQLPIDAVPDITNNQVQVITTSPNLAAQEMELLVTSPLEIALSSLPDKLEIRSISRFGLSVITIVFKDEVDVYKARQWVSERLSMARDQLPAGVSTPELGPPSTGLSEIYQYILVPEKGYETQYSLTQLRTLQDWVVKRQLLGIDGVADVSSFGGKIREVQISVRPDRLKSNNLGIEDIFKALESNNANTGSAYVEKNDFAFFIRGVGLIKDPQELMQVPIALRSGVPVLLRDVAEVQEGSSVRYGAMTRDGKGEVVGGIVLMLKGRNSNDVIGRVKEKTAQIQSALPQGIRIESFIDRSKLISNAISTVAKNLIEGGLIVIFVLVLILGNLRAGLIVASVIPLSMLFAITLMNAFGMSGNLMSLGAIDFGLIVDGAVIIVEYVLHLVHDRYKTTLPDKKEMTYLSTKASGEMMSSAVFGQLIIMIVYLPILSLAGIEGKMFKPMAFTVAFMLLGALILCLTYVPLMASIPSLAKKGWLSKKADSVFAWLEQKYAGGLEWVMKHRIAVISISLALMVLSFYQFTQTGGEFMPTLEEGDFAVETRLITGSSLDKTVSVCSDIEKQLKANFPEIRNVVSRIGTSEIPTDPMPMESADVIIELKDKSEWTHGKTMNELAEAMKAKAEELPGVAFSFQQPIQMRFNELMTGVKTDVAIKIYGEDISLLANKAEEVSHAITGISGVKDISVERVEGLPQLTIQYRRDKLAQYGISVSEANRVLESSVAGSRAGTFYEDDRRFGIVIRLQEDIRKNPESLRELPVRLSSGEMVPFSELADIQISEGPMQISRDNAKRRITIGLNVRNRDVESVVRDIQKRLKKKVMLPAGYYFTYGGQFENLNEAKSRLAIAVPVALLLILVLLYFSFRSITKTLLIFTAVPLAAIGGIWMLTLRGMPFSISAGVGFIALFGVAVLNGIVMMSYIGKLEEESESFGYDVIIRACRSRLRPVIMTALVASLGFLPMAISTSAGAEVQKPLATVVMGGLITSTLLTLFVLPVGYFMVKRLSEKNRINTLFVLILLGLISSSPVKAQKTFNLNELNEIALKNNRHIRQALLEIKEAEAYRKSSFNPGKTQFYYSQGQINSLLIDNSLQINQSFAFPTYYTALNQFWKKLTDEKKFRLQDLERQVKLQVSQAYYHLAFQYERVKLLEEMDSLFSILRQQADIQYKQGALSRLQKLSLENLSAAYRQELQQTRQEIDIRKADLIRIVQPNDTSQFDIRTENLMPERLKMFNLNENIEQHPLLKASEAANMKNEENIRVEKGKYWPDFTLGYLRQTIDKKPDNQVVSIGIGLPLVSRPFRKQIEAAKLQQQISLLEKEVVSIQLTTQAKQLQLRDQRLRQQLTYYQQQAIPEANELKRVALESRKAGEISSFEMLQYLRQSREIRQQYLQAWLEYYLNESELNYTLQP